MSDIEQMQFTQDWLTSAEFSEVERQCILGKDVAQHEQRRADFNWVGSFLHYQVGLHEEELVDWFRQSMRGLGNRRPLTVWKGEDGFEKVYQLAQQWQEQTAENLGDDFVPQEGRVTMPTISEQHGMEAVVNVFRNILMECGVQVDAADSRQRQGVLWNGDEDDAFAINFNGTNDEVEGYKIGLTNGRSSKRLSVLLLKHPTGLRQVAMASIFETIEGAPDDSIGPSDFDPFPKRAEAEPFVRRAQECLEAGELVKAG